jgi:hypothetical protein
MIVKIIDHKQKARFVNASFIKAIHEKGPAKCQVEVSGWTTRITVDQPAEAVAEIVSAALPTNIDAILAAEEERQQQAQSAATIAVIG